MLTLRVKDGERLHFFTGDGEIVIHAKIVGGTVKLSCDAPDEVRIVRGKIVDDVGTEMFQEPRKGAGDAAAFV